MAQGRPGVGAGWATVLLVMLTAIGGCADQPAPPGPAAPPPSALDLLGQRGELRVCSTGDYRPFTFRDPANGRWSGIDIGMAKDMASKLKLKLALVATSWKNMAGDLTAGRCDLAMGGISVTLDRARQAAFSNWYLMDGKAAVTRCTQAARFANLAAIDRPGVRVVVNPGGTNADYDHKALRQATVVTYPDNNTIFDELLQGHDDVMITDAGEARWQAAQHPGLLCAVNPDHPFTREPKAYLLPRNDQVWQQWVDEWLSLDLADGTYQRFSQAWYRPPPASAPSPAATGH